MPKKKKRILFKVYSDGASFNNGSKNPDLPQFCSLGYVITRDDEIVLKGSKLVSEGETSSNIYAELYASIYVLVKLENLIKKLFRKEINGDKVDIELYSDSKYVIDGSSKYIKDWVKNGWRNSNRKEVSHIDLWKKMKQRFLDNPDYNIKFFHVRAHTGAIDFNSRMNELCDVLASSIIKKESIKRNLVRDKAKELSQSNLLKEIIIDNMDLNNYKFRRVFNLFINDLIYNVENDRRVVKLDEDLFEDYYKIDSLLVTFFSLLNYDINDTMVKKLISEFRYKIRTLLEVNSIKKSNTNKDFDLNEGE